MTPATRHRQAAELHAAHLDQGFLSTLGVPVLERLYRAIDETPGCVLLVEEVEGRVVGFVAGGMGMGPIYRQLLRSPVGLGLALLPSLAHPRKLARMIEILRYGGGPSLAGLPKAELLSIAVHPDWRGQQVADRLYARLCEHFQAAGIASFRITVGDPLAAAHRFYRRMGAVPTTRIEVHRGAGSVVYVQAPPGNVDSHPATG